MKQKMSSEFIYQLFALLIAVIVVHAVYVGAIRPSADAQLQRQATLLAAGQEVATNRSLALPGITVSVAESLDSLRKIAGDGVADRVEFRSDPFIEKIVAGWATRFEPERALAMGFEADSGIDEIIEQFVEDDLGGCIAI